jgi:hypothetical protein
MARRKHHYVYALIDPRDCAPFYIGKGTSERLVRHFRSVPKRFQGEQGSDKHRIIEEIKAAGLKPAATVLSNHLTDEDALQAEKKMIEKLGLGNLTNQNIGGGGDKSKKTETPKVSTAVNGHHHRRLTEKLERFCLAVIDPNVTTGADAWLISHPESKASRKTASEEASKLMARPKIAQRLDELRAPVVNAGRYSLGQAIEGQERAVELADDTSNAGAMSGAYREIGKMSDLYPREGAQVEVKVVNQTVQLTDTELARRLAHVIEAGAIDQP